MAGGNTVEHITDDLAKAKFQDGALPTDVQLANQMLRTRGAITDIKTHLEVVWYKPHRNIWMHFRSRAHAETAVRALNGTAVQGLKLKCALKTTTKPSIELFTAHISDAIETIELSDLTSLVRQQPVDTIFGKFNYPLETDEVKLIRDKIEARAGEPVLDHQMIHASNELKCKANFVFASEAPNLSAAAKSLNGLVMREFGKSKIFVTEHLTVYLAVDNDIYLRHSKALKAIAGLAWKEHKIKVKIFDGDLRNRRGTFLVSIKGNGREDVKKVKALVDACLRADAIMGLQRQTQTLPRKYKVELKLSKDYKRAVNGGIARLEALVGWTNVSFHDDDDSSTVTYIVTEDKADKARRIFSADPQVAGPEPSVEECPICAEDFLKLLVFPNCNHTVCSGCLRNYCSIDLNAGDRLPLKCFSAVECGSVLPTSWLLEHLSTADFQELLRSAIAIHCRENPASFMRCNGSDCNDFLTISPKFSKEVCPTCLTVNCTACKRLYHFGQTCQQYEAQIKQDNELFDRHLAESDGKRCPRCDTPTFRDGGCYHISCIGCNAHYCWLCLAVSNNMGDIYNHMENVHGTNGLGPEDLAAVLLGGWALEVAGFEDPDNPRLDPLVVHRQRIQREGLPGQVFADFGRARDAMADMVAVMERVAAMVPIDGAELGEVQAGATALARAPAPGAAAAAAAAPEPVVGAGGAWAEEEGDGVQW